jgi:hypothetical protein
MLFTKKEYNKTRQTLGNIREKYRKPIFLYTFPTEKLITGSQTRDIKKTVL